ncbi:MFS transporter [Sphingobacterium spiritivorum]|uniref:Nucleoside transporter n=1 Tax=Sphingobacterium spiritivorum ATCC 33861 TaxID=525373 RepID=D7VQ14_SPHSI|nr:MFS transporter [Sphingobacterium spiritivorum]EFK55865.1 nucleoside transporter [Sphingobacterium spiritivorum ATCC 33861]QQT35997.1 MFS transporter [Sphingobacterium spiritivorum]WQD32727.1 MFS transporter [Sphingobacterium spiritivorum]SUJ14067.1 Putative nucleoside transporter yegT [Sphingobacterium spiritivorum]
MSTGIKIKLSFMMFLEFFIWGAWFVTLGTFLSKSLNATGLESANVFSTQSWGAIVAPFIIGMIADRFFNAERILGVLHIVGAFLMYQMYQSTSVSEFYPYVLGYMLLYMPTLSLVNSVSFRQMKNPEKEFSIIRIFGTLGWIVAGLAISYIFKWDAGDGLLKNTFLMAGIASLVLGLFSFTLPKTPPVKIEQTEKATVGQILGLDAVKLLKDKNFLLFFISSILICIPLAFYYQNANVFLSEINLENPTGKMTIGQISEVLFLLLLPVFFTRFGFKKTILVGMLAWAVRYLMFAYGNAGDLTFMLITGIALHGICYDFFFVSGQIYTDNKAGAKYKSSAQGLITLATYGVGQLIGFWVAGYVSDMYIDLKSTDVALFWNKVWVIPAGIAVVVFLFFLIFFKDEKIESTKETETI